MATMTGAGKPNTKNDPCTWAGPKHTHDIIKDSLQQDGKVDRNDGSISGWARPNSFFDDVNYPKNKDKDGNLELFVKVPERWGKNKSYLEDYSIQRHHVIPCAVITAIPELKTNLKSLGWDINDQEKNGICLPAYEEGIFWHDLPRHCGYPAAHATYNANLQSELKTAWNTWKNLCKEDEETELLEEIQAYVNEKRNLIIRWDSAVFLVNDNMGDRIKSFNNAGYTIPPIVIQHKKRKYSGNAE